MSLVEFDDKEESFVSLLENSFINIQSFEPGQLVESQIVSISAGTVFILLDGKSEGQIDGEEFLNRDGQITVNEGDIVKAYFVSSKGGDMLFTTKIDGSKAGKEAIKSAYENSIPVEGLISGIIKGGYQITIGETRAFCPFSQLGLKRVEEPESLVGEKRTFKIIEFSEGGRNILVSSRVIFEEEKASKKAELQQELTKGMVVKATVKSLEKFGAFVDLMGLQALLPISEISRTRVNNVADHLTIGQEIEVSILNLDWENDRVSVSLKALIRDPWDEAVTKYREDTKHSGEVSRIANFGVFVTLEPGLDGLIHVSDFKGESGDKNSGDGLKLGQKISVLVKDCNAKERRIALKEVTSDKEYEENKKYFDTDDGDTYNPFAALLNGK